MDDRNGWREREWEKSMWAAQHDDYYYKWV